MKKNSEQNKIYGIHPVLEAINAGTPIEKIFIKAELDHEVKDKAYEYGKIHKIPVQKVPIAKLNKLFPGKQHQGIGAITAIIEYFSLEELVPFMFENDAVPLIIILDGISDVRNFGAIARTAYGAGATAIVIPNQNAASINDIAMKTSAGALNHIPICREKSLIQSVEFLQMSGIRVYAVTEKAYHSVHTVDFKVPSAIIMGSEGKGIHQKLITAADAHVKVPIMSDLDSYNVSVATGMILYEAMLQRQ